MKSIRLKKGLIATLLVTAFWVMGVNEIQAAPQRVIVIFDDAVNEPARENIIKGVDGILVKSLPSVNGKVAILPANAVAALGGIAGVVRVDPDAIVKALPHKPGHDKGGGNGEPPPGQTLPWGVDRIDAELAWGTSRGTNINVAIIDTGIDEDHGDLVDNIQGGINFVSKGLKPADPNKWDDDNGHGTHVAGTVAAVDNSVGVVGVAPEANLWAVKVLDRRGSGYVSDVVEGIYWSINNNMDVINMSLGTTVDITTLRQACDDAEAAGIVSVAAAGNSGDGNGATNEVGYPAKYTSVLAVAATASDDSTPFWSSEGEEVELAGPGVDVLSTWKGGGYETISGTSMATPHVTGTVALAIAALVNNVRERLQNTADDLGPSGRDNFYGHGLVDAEEATTGTQTQAAPPRPRIYSTSKLATMWGTIKQSR